MKEEIKLDNEKKVKLKQLQEQARNGGIGFMERLLIAHYDETVECLRDNAGIFRKDNTTTNLILV